MKYFLCVHVHATFASASSSDSWLYMEFPHIKSKKPAKAFIKTLCKNFPRLKYSEIAISKLDDITIFYCEDETFSNVNAGFGKSFEKTPEFKALLGKYFSYGLTEKKPDEIKKHYDNDRTREYARLKKQGYVYHFQYEEYSRDKIQGGFSDAVFNHKSIVDYTQSYPHGFIGHSVRKPELDAYFEKVFMKLERPIYMGVPTLLDIFTCWLTSSDGRHFGDSLEGLPLVQQKKKIREGLKNIYNTAFVYNLKEHKGTWDSTVQLSEKYKHRLIA